MALKSSLFTGTGPAFDRLKKAFESHAFHIKEGQTGPGQEGAVALIQAALNQLGHSLVEDGKFGRKTGDAVFAYKNSKSPKILFPGQSVPDRIVGIGTLVALDLDLLKGGGGGGGGGATTKPVDIVVYISGFQKPGGARIVGARDGDGFRAHDPIKRISPRANSVRDFIGLEGSLDTLAGVFSLMAELSLKVDTLNVRKIIIYGYSAGGSNAMELARQLSNSASARKFIGLKPVEIDLLVLVDAAERSDSPLKVNRFIPANVKSVVNFFQTSPSPLGRAHGGRVTLETANQVSVRQTALFEQDLTNELGLNLPGFSKHQEIEKATVDRCLRKINDELGP